MAIALREHESNIKKSGGTIHRQFFIGTSCETGNHISDTALAAGMDVFLAKPFTPSDLQLFIQPHTRYHENH